MTRALRALAPALLLFLLIPSLVLAHAELVRSEPANGESLPEAPAVVRLTFSEPVEASFSALHVYAADRARVEEGSVAVAPWDVRVLQARLRALPAGTYTVVWRALSLDGHVVRGSFVFGVGTGVVATPLADLALVPGGPPAPVVVSARWLTFLAAFTLLGGFGFALLVLAPSVRHTATRGRAVENRVTHAWLPAAWAALAVLLVTSFLSLLLQAADATGVSLNEVLAGRSVTRVLAATRYGSFWLARMSLLLVLAAVLAWLATAGPHRRTVAWWAGLVLSAGVLLTISASGHASTAPEAFVSVFADWLHLLAGGVWIGGLIALRLALPRVSPSSKQVERTDLYAALVPRFSRLALASVGALLLTGLYASLVWVPGWNALVDTAYGAALSGKLLLVAPLLAVGTLNLLLLRPWLLRTETSRATVVSMAHPRHLFRALVLTEIVLAAGVIGVTAILAGLPPSRAVAAEGAPFSEAAALAAHRVTLGITPNRAGSNDVRVEVADSTGAPARDIRAVTASLSMRDMDMGMRDLELTRGDSGKFEAQTNALAMAGRWSVQVTLNTHGGTEQVEFGVPIGGAADSGLPLISPLRILGLAFPTVAVGLGVVLAGAYLIFPVPAGRQPRYRRGTNVVAVALIAGGLAVAGNSVGAAAWRSLPNPVVPDQASLLRGQAVYAAACAACHGERGRGDGPAGARLVPRPADFRLHLAAGHTDRELFQWIAQGIDGTAMPAFGDRLSESERWDVVNFIRTLATIEGAAS